MLTFGDYVAVVRRRMWWVIGAVAVCLLLALAYSKHQTPKYQAEATVVVGNVTPPPAFGGGGGSSGTSIERYVATQATIGSSTQVAALTVQDPKARAGSISPKQFVAMSSVTADSTANTLHFTVVAHSADQAISLVNAFAYQYMQRAKTLLDAATQPTIDGLNRAIAGYGPNQVTALQTARANLMEVTNVRERAGSPDHGLEPGDERDEGSAQDDAKSADRAGIRDRRRACAGIHHRRCR